MLDVDQVTALAPDAKAVAAARKTASPSKWGGLGRSDRALWGECKGSATYKVQVDLNGLAAKCSCPSRKLPCKHSLALMMIYAREGASLPEGQPPDWAAEWLEGRDARAAKKAEKAAAPPKPVDEAAKAKRDEKRQDKVDDGLAALRAWLSDLGRTGLSQLETRPEAIEEQAARLVDAQAGGLASRLRRLHEHVGTGPDWPERVLGQLGRIALVIEAWSRRDQLPGPMVDDLKALLGFKVEPTAEGVADRWVVLGQWEEQIDDRLRGHRAWLRGLDSGRDALVLQFAFGANPFGERFVSGTVQPMTLAFYPSVRPQRAAVLLRDGAPEPVEALPACASIAAFLEEQADALACNPFLESLPCRLAGVVPVPDQPAVVADEHGALPLIAAGHWKLLAASGGHPVDLFGEWDGDALRPLAVVGRDGFVGLT